MNINKETYEEYFLLYVDGELSQAERLEVEAFAGKHPELKEELILLSETVSTPDQTVAFDGKEQLYRRQRRAVILPFNWRSMAVAAALLLLLGAGWVYFIFPSGPRNGSALPTAYIKAPEKTSRAAFEKPVVKIYAGDKANSHRTVPAVKAPAQDVAKITTSGHLQTRTIHTQMNREAWKKASSVQPKEQSENVEPENNIATVPPASLHKVDVVSNATDKVDIPVRGQNLVANQPPAQSQPIQYVNETGSTDNDKIYFANTSFSKRNSLRVVFRKASRIIDRITTLQ